MTVLSLQHRNRLRLVLARHPEVRRAIYVETKPRPLLVIEYDERPPSVEDAKARIEAIMASVAPALGAAAGRLGFPAGGPEDVAPRVRGGEVVYERGQ